MSNRPGWRDEAIGEVKSVVPMATADARRVVDAVLAVVEREFTLIPKNLREGISASTVEDR